MLVTRQSGLSDGRGGNRLRVPATQRAIYAGHEYLTRTGQAAALQQGVGHPPHPVRPGSVEPAAVIPVGHRDDVKQRGQLRVLKLMGDRQRERTSVRWR